MKIITILCLLFTLQMFSQQGELLSWKEASISNKISLTTSKADFDKKYKSDSIVAPKAGEICATTEGTNVQMLYYKGVKFEVDNGIMNFRSIDFRQRRNMWLAFKDDWFDHTTTLKNFTKTYPDAALYMDDVETETGEILQMISLLSDESNEYEWQFYFKEGKLQYIECFFFCN